MYKIFCLWTQGRYKKNKKNTFPMKYTNHLFYSNSKTFAIIHYKSNGIIVIETAIEFRLIYFNKKGSVCRILYFLAHIILKKIVLKYTSNHVNKIF